MKEFQYVIRDDKGIHARPAGLFVKEATPFSCRITLEKDDKQADAKRILSVMSLGVRKGDTITLRTDGSDEEEALSRLRSFLEQNL